MRFLNRVFAAVVVVGAAWAAGCASPPAETPDGDGKMMRIWPDVRCEPLPARAMLDEIEMLARAAEPNPTVDGVIQAVCRCRANDKPIDPQKLDEAGHCAKVDKARTFAQKGEWLGCLTELEHGH